MNERGGYGRGWVRAGKLTAVVFEFTGFVVGSVVLGWLADRYLGTEPWLLILFTLSGTCAGFYQMIRSLRVLERKRALKRKRET